VLEIWRRSARADYSEPRDATAAHTPACGARAALVADVSLRVTLSLSFAETKASDFSLRLTGWAKKVGGGTERFIAESASEKFVKVGQHLARLQAAEWLACCTQAQKGPGSYRSRDAVG